MTSLAKRRWFWLIVIFVSIFIVLHVYFAIWVHDYVNRKLSEIPGYRAHDQIHFCALNYDIPDGRVFKD